MHTESPLLLNETDMDLNFSRKRKRSFIQTFPLLIFIVLSCACSSCKKDHKDPISVSECQISPGIDCALQLSGILNGEEVHHLASNAPNDINSSTGFEMSSSTSASGSNDSDTLEFSMGLVLREYDGDDFQGIKSNIFFSGIEVTESLSDEKFLDIISSADWSYGDQTAPFQTDPYLVFIDIGSLLSWRYDSTSTVVQSNNTFIMEETELYYHDSITYVRFFASFSCKLEDLENNDITELTDGRVIGLLRKPDLPLGW